MPTATRANTTSASATAANAVTTPLFGLTGGGMNKGIAVAIAHSGGLGDSPVQSVGYGADVGFFIAAQADPLGGGMVEWWVIAPVTTTSDVVVVSFDPTVSVTALVFVQEIVDWGTQGPDASTPGGNGLLGATYTVNITVVDSTGGRQQTIAVPATFGLVLGCACSADTTATVAAASGTSLHTAVAGAGANRIAFAVLGLQATGGSDAVSFTNSTPAPYAILAMAALGDALEGIIRARGMVPIVRG